MASWSDRWTRVRAQIDALPRPVRVVAVTVVGGTVVLTGVAMLVLPGPGILAILAGLALLATEFAWARRWLDRARAAGQAGVDKGREVWDRRRSAPDPVRTTEPVDAPGPVEAQDPHDPQDPVDPVGASR
ncbi:PGPGW domain-containing protein [Cellulomonas wangsupingiae]|uniref:PGPGW domain-containing protein n=1 Tax=Cellulomonas wangsupingiae TaxID=2968085 RepID=UPI0027E1955F|nr:PGPGW domain-containing protein [Cellulomonas wangsupingiae]